MILHNLFEHRTAVAGCTGVDVGDSHCFSPTPQTTRVASPAGVDTTSSNSLNSISTLYFPGGLCWSFSDYPSSICPRSVRHHADGLCGAGTVCSPTSFYINTQDDTTLEMTPGYFPSFVADTQHDPALEGTLIMLHHIPGISSLNNTLRRREHWLCSVLYVHDHRFNRRGHVSSETLFLLRLNQFSPLVLYYEQYTKLPGV